MAKKRVKGYTRKVKGRKTKEVQEILGGKEYEEVIHRDNLVIL